MSKSLAATILIAFVLVTFSVAAVASPWTNGLPATYVIGQPGFTSKANGTSATSLWSPRDVAVDPAHQKLYVVDALNNRVLRYGLPVADNQPAAERVFGQADMVSNVAALTRNGLNRPSGVAVDSVGRLWVADRLNNRVLWYNDAYAIASDGPDADGVLGQADFVSGGSATTQNRMNWPMDLVAGEDARLYVADSENHRVLRFENAASKVPGANADGVLGQPDFTSADYATSQNEMHTPRGVALFGTTLFVAEYGSNRILRFDNAASLPDGADADGVLGQSDFDSAWSLISQSRLEATARISVDADGNLYVTDALSANRLLVFLHASSKPNGADADSVLGQVDFTSSGVGTTQDQFNLDPMGGGMVFDPVSRILAVTDDNNNRVMIFQLWQVYLPLVAR